MMLVGLAGYARCGKDTVGRYMCENRGFERGAFADAVRTTLYRINPFVRLPRRFRKRHAFDKRWVRVAELVDRVGWETAKSLREVREELQRVGTEAGRDVHGDHLWVDALMRSLEGKDRVVITDVRFPNEAEAIKKAGGHVYRIVRAGVTATNGHISERALDEWEFDGYIINDGTLEDLERQVRFKLNEILVDPMFDAA